MNPVTAVLRRVFDKPLHLQSDFAREYDAVVAALASQGFISSIDGVNRYGNKWRITGIGIDLLRDEGVL